MISMEQLGHSGQVPCADDYAFDPSQMMHWQEIMSWYSINGMILRRIFLARDIAQHEPLSMGMNGGTRWYNNPQV